jgi:4-diphosphocytidyl-2-C-methyl-D-erythritol kinase
VLTPAKINLDLLITGRRKDGFHLLDSVVVFVGYGDELTAKAADGLSLDIKGAFANKLNNDPENLVLKAARKLCEFAGVKPDIKFQLTKNLPVSSGIGGGSSNAAAALKLTMELLNLDVGDVDLRKLALSLGADVPVCLQSNTSHMTGIGENIKQIDLCGGQPILLVNPGVSVSTPDIFKSFKNMALPFTSRKPVDFNQINWTLMLEHLKASKNDLQMPASVINASVSEVIEKLKNLEGLIFSRMSGSGATCFALFESDDLCKKAAKSLSNQHETWWIKATNII